MRNRFLPTCSYRRRISLVLPLSSCTTQHCIMSGHNPTLHKHWSTRLDSWPLLPLCPPIDVSPRQSRQLSNEHEKSWRDFWKPHSQGCISTQLHWLWAHLRSNDRGVQEKGSTRNTCISLFDASMPGVIRVQYRCTVLLCAFTWDFQETVRHIRTTIALIVSDKSKMQEKIQDHFTLRMWMTSGAVKSLTTVTMTGTLRNCRPIHWVVGWAGPVWQHKPNVSNMKRANQSPAMATGVVSVWGHLSTSYSRFSMREHYCPIERLRHFPPAPRYRRALSSCPLTLFASRSASVLWFRIASVCLLRIALLLVSFHYCWVKACAMECLALQRHVQPQEFWCEDIEKCRETLQYSSAVQTKFTLKTPISVLSKQTVDKWQKRVRHATAPQGFICITITSLLWSDLGQQMLCIPCASSPKECPYVHCIPISGE